MAIEYWGRRASDSEIRKMPRAVGKALSQTPAARTQDPTGDWLAVWIMPDKYKAEALRFRRERLAEMWVEPIWTWERGPWAKPKAVLEHTQQKPKSPQTQKPRRQPKKKPVLEHTQPKPKPAPQLSRADVLKVHAMGAHTWTVQDLAGQVCTSETAAQRWAAKMTKLGVLAGDAGRYTVKTEGVICPLPKPRAPKVEGPACFGECGRWRKAPARSHALAIGPAVALYDGEGRPYVSRLELLDLSTVRASHGQDFRPTEGYPTDLQPRDRGAKAARLQVLEMARTLDHLRMVAPSSSAAEGPPVVWRDGAAAYVVSGNGRTMALQRGGTAAQPGYRAALARRWRSTQLDRRAAAHASPVIVVRVLLNTDLQTAVQLAGASQTSTSAELSTLERAQSRARGLGITDPLGLGRPFEWREAITTATVERFKASNKGWWAALLSRVDAARRPSMAEPEAAAQLINDVLIGGLPADIIAHGLGDALAQAALIGALPGVWSLECRHKRGLVFGSWRLLPRLSDARAWVGKAGRKSLTALADGAALDARQAALFGEAEIGARGFDPLAVAMGAAMVRAGRRVEPMSAAAGYLAAYLSDAEQYRPDMPTLFGSPSQGDPAATMARIARFKLTR
jgi:hypothetical protein